MAIEVPHDLVIVARFQNVPAAHIAKCRLEAAGIRAWVFGEHHIWADWLVSNAIGGVRVLVKDTDEELAGEVLDGEAEAESPGSPAQSPPPIVAESSPAVTIIREADENVCPNCGSPEIYRQIQNRRWIMLSVVLLGFPLFALWRRWQCERCGHRWDGTSHSAVQESLALPVAQPEQEHGDTRTSHWICAKCHREIDSSLDVCWKCGTAADGSLDPDFAPDNEGTDLDEPAKAEIRVAKAKLKAADRAAEFAAVLADPTRDPNQRLDAILRIERSRNPNFIPLLVGAIKTDPSSLVVNYAIGVLGTFRYKSAVEGLIDCLEIDFRRLAGSEVNETHDAHRNAIGYALFDLTGAELGTDKQPWENWWSKNGNAIETLA